MLMAEDVMFVLLARRLCDSGGGCPSERGSPLTRRGRGVRSREEEQSTDTALLAWLTSPAALPFLPRFKICDLCTPCGELTHTNTSLPSPLPSPPAISGSLSPLLGSRGQTVSWELESQ